MTPASVSREQTLVLHAVRLLGSADDARAAARFGLDRAVVAEALLDAEASGWVRRVRVSPPAWTLTDAGRAANERGLAAELDAAGTRAQVLEVLDAFGELNAQLLTAMTAWQLRPLPGDPLAANDHSDHRWDERVVERVAALAGRLAPLDARLSAALPRCAGYHARFVAALGRVRRGEHRWLAEPGIDSCHAVWFELHEDLLATLGVERGSR